MQRVLVALALSAGATRALQFAAPVRLHKTLARAEADAPVTSADMDDAAEAAAPAVEAAVAVEAAIDTEAGAPAPARAAAIAARGCTAKRGPPRWPPGVHITRGAYGPGGPRASRGALHVSGYVPHTPSRCVPHFRLRAIRVRATRAVRPGQVTPGQATPGPGGPCRARAVRGDHVRAA